MLLLPRRIVSGERATLAVLDMNGRLTPGVTVNFSNGDRLTTDATGRALFVAPLNPGVIYGSIAGRTGRVATAILAPGEAASTSIEVSSAPQFASEIAELFGGNPLRASSSGGAENLARFEIVGRKNGSFLISIRLVPFLGRR